MTDRIFPKANRWASLPGLPDHANIAEDGTHEELLHRRPLRRLLG
ncbi:hypothetical protein [Nocardia salmonicida]